MAKLQSFKAITIYGCHMPHVYSKVDDLITTPPQPNVGSGQCVALVEKYASVSRPATSWEEGAAVRGNMSLAKGTAIATFKDGKYQSHRHGNHAALYFSQDASGIWVVDQYSSSGGIRKRLLRFKGKDKNGNYLDPSNNGDAFSVIK
jgi:hypothetical protein